MNMKCKHYLRRVARKPFFEKWILETHKENDEWNYDLVYVDLENDCNVYVFVTEKEFLESEEYITVLEGLCHDWCTFEGINWNINSILLPEDIIDQDEKIESFVEQKIGHILKKS